jgi:hypothetical protein
LNRIYTRRTAAQRIGAFLAEHYWLRALAALLFVALLCTAAEAACIPLDCVYDPRIGAP